MLFELRSDLNVIKKGGLLKKATSWINDFDAWFIEFLNGYSLTILRISLAVIFIWFGVLKIFGDSPANDLITKTIYWFNPDVFIPILGAWETAIGLCLIVPFLNRAGLFLLALQMPGTFLPLILLPEVCFQSIPYNLTLEGQYIIKNLVLIGAAMAVGGRLTPRKIENVSTPTN
ncbi:MAG: DoxX family protein [Candidatus Nanopelagicaceae bacterium]|nr:DoxX family protein [Candidatus Nanopelagicaceae bacterium]